MKIIIKKSDVNAMIKHAFEDLPNEACGLIAGIDRDDGVREIKKVYLLTNIDHANEHFTIDPKEHLQSIKDMRTNGLKPLGNWHSHPETPSRSSEEDIRLAVDSKATYMILSLMDRSNPVLNAFHVENDISTKEELEILE